MTDTTMHPERNGTSYVLIGDEGGARFSDELRRFIGVFLRGWLIIGLSIIGFLALGIAYVLTATPMYVADTEILLDPHSKQLVNAEVVDTRLAASAIGPDTLLLDSQVRVLLSQSVLRKLIAAENLTSDPEFSEPGLMTKLFGEQGADSVDPVPERVLKALYDSLSVTRETNTYVISVAFKTEDPLKSARLANRLAEIYLAEISGATLNTTEETAEALESRLETLRAEAEAAAREVEDYRRANGLVGAQNMLVVEQQLGDLNSQLANARVTRNAAEAELAQVQEALQAPSGSAARLGAINSGIVQQLQIDLSNLDIEEARLRARLLPQHPDIIAVTEQKVALLASIEAELSRTEERLKAAVENARRQEADLTSQVADLQSEAANSNDRSVRLRELERDAQTSQALYETFLRRTKEVWEQTELPSQSARVISPAYPPSRPSEPRRVLLIAASLILGGLVGATVVWLRDIFRSDDGSRRAPAPASPQPKTRQAEQPAQAQASAAVAATPVATTAATAPATQIQTSELRRQYTPKNAPRTRLTTQADRSLRPVSGYNYRPRAAGADTVPPMPPRTGGRPFPPGRRD